MTKGFFLDAPNASLYPPDLIAYARTWMLKPCGMRIPMHNLSMYAPLDTTGIPVNFDILNSFNTGNVPMFLSGLKVRPVFITPAQDSDWRVRFFTAALKACPWLAGVEPYNEVYYTDLSHIPETAPGYPNNVAVAAELIKTCRGLRVANPGKLIFGPTHQSVLQQFDPVLMEFVKQGGLDVIDCLTFHDYNDHDDPTAKLAWLKSLIGNKPALNNEFGFWNVTTKPLCTAAHNAAYVAAYRTAGIPILGYALLANYAPTADLINPWQGGSLVMTPELQNIVTAWGAGCPSICDAPSPVVPPPQPPSPPPAPVPPPAFTKAKVRIAGQRKGGSFTIQVDNGAIDVLGNLTGSGVNVPGTASASATIKGVLT